MANLEISDGTILYGMMGSGKTTLGMALAEHLTQPYIDTDSVVELYARATCAEIIADPGRDFGQIQQTAIMACHPEAPTVIATGGSVAMYPEITRHLGQFGTSVFLRVEPDVLETRLSPERIAALNNPKKLSFADLYAARIPSYEAAARFTITVGDETVSQTLVKLLEVLGK